MKIVIDIPEGDYKEVKEDTYSGTPFENRVFSAIANGKPYEGRKTGRWIHTGVIGNPIIMGRCSECLEIVSWDSETGVSFEDYKFCPFCGAKMEVDDD